MTTPAADASLAGQKLKDQDLVQFKLSMDALKKRLSDPEAKEKQLRKACRNFEAVFLGKLWEQMRATVPKEGYLHSPQEDAYLSMFDQAFSEKMADSGGIGLADMLYGNLKQRLADMGREALPGRMSAPRAPEAAEGAAVPDQAAADSVSAGPLADPAVLNPLAASPVGAEAVAAVAAPAQAGVKSLAESGRDPRRSPARETSATALGRHTELKPLHRPGEPMALGRSSRRGGQTWMQAPERVAQEASTPAASISGTPPQRTPQVAETPAQVASQLEALIRHIESGGTPSATPTESSATSPAPSVSVPQPGGVRVYQGRQSEAQRPGRKLAKIG
ncbi:MAG TPA: rod-binding protein [Desulfovibrio sp.]|uniref:rod-binding protein n=1 Tax=Desulfovibrio TaxID=872 RepID=UPI002C491B6D|nr:rod-binding protein [Desulfovibrio sp.]HMM37876.1 rod-binding protein [Desulfovibrio sp.]